MENLRTYQRLEDQIQLLLEKDDNPGLKKLLKKEHPADIAQALEHLDAPDRRHVFILLEVEQRAEVANEFGSQVARQVLEGLPIKDIAAVLNRLPMDEAARLVAVFHRRRPVILKALDPQHMADIQQLLRYPAESAGQMMTEQFAKLRPDMTAQQALARLRRITKDVETFTNLYVVDEDDHLLGVVSLREVVVAPPKARLKSLMNADIISVYPETDREEVARLISRYDFLAMPVVDAHGRMLGIITADDVIDVLAAENTEDLLKFGAVEVGGLLDEPYFTIPIPTVVRKRVGWLLLLFVAETFTGTVLRYFSNELAAVVALSFFIPLLIGTGGNTGAQTVSTLIRGLALGEVTTRDIWRVIRRELVSGLMIGLLLGIVAFFRALLWGSGTDLALTVALAILAICTWANTIGSLIPLVAQKFKIDPAAVSAPLITTLVDATGLAIYLLVAKVTLGL